MPVTNRGVVATCRRHYEFFSPIKIGSIPRVQIHMNRHPYCSVYTYQSLLKHPHNISSIIHRLFVFSPLNHVLEGILHSLKVFLLRTHGWLPPSPPHPRYQPFLQREVGFMGCHIPRSLRCRTSITRLIWRMSRSLVVGKIGEEIVEFVWTAYNTATVVDTFRFITCARDVVLKAAENARHFDTSTLRHYRHFPYVLPRYFRYTNGRIRWEERRAVDNRYHHQMYIDNHFSRTLGLDFGRSFCS